MFVSANGGHYLDEWNVKWRDLISGIQNVPLGHGHPAVRHAITRANNTGLINCYNEQSDARRILERRLKNTYPEMDWAICSTGTEAIERILQLIKIRRGDAWVGRVLYLKGAFHGKSYALAKARYDGWGSDLLQVADERTINEPFDALIYEPVQGLTGEIPDEPLLMSLCEAVGAYLIADEMITGFGRCGPAFMSNLAHYVAAGKGVASGLPITFIGSRLPIGEILTGWTTTGAGNALCCEVAAETLRHLSTYPPRVAMFERVLKEFFPNNVSGKGALLYISVSDPKEAQKRLRAVRMVALYTDSAVRLAPFLYMTEEDWREACRVLLFELKDILA